MMAAAAQHSQRRRLYIQVVGGEETWAALTLMRVLTPVCPAAAVSSRPVLGKVIRRVDTGGHTQQPLITVGDVTIVEHFVK